jgi:hypothetical protein
MLLTPRRTLQRGFLECFIFRRENIELCPNSPPPNRFAEI